MKNQTVLILSMFSLLYCANLSANNFENDVFDFVFEASDEALNELADEGMLNDMTDEEIINYQLVISNLLTDEVLMLDSFDMPGSNEIHTQYFLGSVKKLGKKALRKGKKLTRKGLAALAFLKKTKKYLPKIKKLAKSLGISKKDFIDLVKLWAKSNLN